MIIFSFALFLLGIFYKNEYALQTNYLISPQGTVNDIATS